MSDDAETILAEILALALEREVRPGETVRRADEPKWDSLKHLEIVMAVEGALSVAFSTEEMAAVEGSDDLLRKVRARG